jgi:hypothetical protein
MILARILFSFSRYSRYLLADLEEQNGMDDLARSFFALLSIEIRHARWRAPFLAIVFATLVPALTLDAWWSFILSQIPLKAGLARDAGFLMIDLAVTGILCAGVGVLCSRGGLLFAIPAAWIFTLLAQVIARGTMPVWCTATLLAVVTTSLSLGTIAAHSARQGAPYEVA